MFLRGLALLLGSGLLSLCAADVPLSTEVQDLAFEGGVSNGQPRVVIQALLKGMSEEKKPLVYVCALHHTIQATALQLNHTLHATFDLRQGEAGEIVLAVAGAGLIKSVTGTNLLFWSLRTETNGTRSLVLLPARAEKPWKQMSVVITAETPLENLPATVPPLALSAPEAALFQGFLRVVAPAGLAVQALEPTGLTPVELDYLPADMQAGCPPGDPEPLAFRFHAPRYGVTLKLQRADPEARVVVLRNAQLVGRFGDRTAAFTLTATARVRNPEGGTLELLGGNLALTEVQPDPHWRLQFDNGRFLWTADQAGEFPLRLQFNAAVRSAAGWSSVDFRIAPSALQPVTLQGLPADTQFQFAGAAKPQRTGDDFISFLPPDGQVKLSWKEARPEAEGKLFYAAEMLDQISVSPGLMRQVALIEGKIMQGELNRVALLLRGEGEVTRVQGDQVLAWNVEPVPNTTDRRLVVQFNQPQKDQFGFQVHLQTPLGAFPQTAAAVQLRPLDAIRFAGYLRVVNEGAVRLEVLQALGLSQISPEQFPETDQTRALLATKASQRFAFRFSSPEFQLQIRADNILPELTVSEVLAYHLGQSEKVIDAEIELDIREAPLRELVVRVPKGYALARLAVPGLGDYFLTEPEGADAAQLRLVYGQPTSGRQVLQLRLERNQPPSETNWVLPRVEVAQAKATRGQIGVSADAGLRLTADTSSGLTEMATAFFPKKVAGLQVAYRVTEPAWQVSLRIERLPQSIQADAFHLFSIGEGIAYGSSTLNFLVSGAPVSSFRIELSDEYFNVEFTGKDLRNWQRVAGGYVVQLHSPVTGPYTVLATYERPFKAQGDTLTFTGARPLDAPSEQGYTIVVSAYQFQVRPANVSAGLLALEPGEVPAEYRLFFDAPVLAAYRYTSRPFNLQLALSPLVQGETLSQVVDRARLSTRISKEGQAITDATYFVKNRGQPHFRLALPPDTELWTVTVNGARVVPVRDQQSHLIPLPKLADPNAVNQLDLVLAARAKDAQRVVAGAPLVVAPVLLAEWKFQPDTGQRLAYRGGTLMPAAGVVEASGFAGLNRTFTGPQAGRAGMLAVALVAFVALALSAWGWASRASFKFEFRHTAGALIGLAAFVLAGVALAGLANLAAAQPGDVPHGLTFLAPVQQANSAMTVDLANVPDRLTAGSVVARSWPVLLALAVWLYTLVTSRRWFKPVGLVLGWTVLAWAALRWPQGAPAFIGVLGLFLVLHVLLPSLVRLARVPRRARPSPPPIPPASEGAAPVVAAWILTGLLGLMLATTAGATPVPTPVRGEAAASAAAPPAAGEGAPPVSRARRAAATEPVLAESVVQEIRVEEQNAVAKAVIRWSAQKDQQLPLLREPAVLTDLSYPANALRLVQAPNDARRTQSLVAQESGTYTIELRYQLPVVRRGGESGLALPTQYGLVNQLRLTLVNLDVEVVSAHAVSVQPQPDPTGTNTVAALVLLPVNDAWVAWKPRSRDVRREKAEFYAELIQLYVPTAGVIEGVHQAVIRPARGELTELIFDVPGGATITDVLDATSTSAPVDAKNPKAPGPSIVSLWRFDPDTRKLRVSLSPAQSRPFTLRIGSQVATGPLPFAQALGLVHVSGAAGQPIGVLGIATGSDVQLEETAVATFSPINLEDFPPGPLQALAPRVPGLTLRRAFRYADPAATVTLKAAPVEPDVRVTTQETLSLGEDRTLLAGTVNVAITRAGIFRLSFVLPAGLDVESISSAVMTHWTDLKTAEGRVITVHFKGKTEGEHALAITLTGAGVRATTNWNVPQLIIREATKQRGQLVIVPELGLRLQAGPSDGIAPFDPQEAGIRQKGVLGFRILQVPWSLRLNLEQVAPWIQVTSLQHVQVAEAQLKVAANLQYQIENTGLKALRLRIPTNAESVVFKGEQVADFRPSAAAPLDGLQQWVVKLHRRVIGKYLLQVSYQSAVPERATNVVLRGPQALDADLQRGFLTVQSSDRLQVRAPAVPLALQPAEWQSIPRALMQDLPAAVAHLAFRLVDPLFALPLDLQRHEAARLLPARVQATTLTSVIADDGGMLTQVRLDLLPGDKRLLHVMLPQDARFWFAFVNQNGVWPWTTPTNILIPLEQQSRTDQPIAVEFFFSSQAGTADPGALDLQLLGPKFDLPLENITWRVFLNEKWRVKDWSGTLQLQEEEAARPASVDVATYLRREASLQQQKTKEAEQMLAMGNSLLERGDPQQARRAFQAAYGLSTHDDAFNEDARVQLHNLKLQQALVGLNVRQATVAGEADTASGKLREVRTRKGGAYTQQEAKQIIDSKSAEENAAFMRLAERIVQQQDAAVASPTAIRASIPEQGRLLSFHRAVQVNTWADLRIGLEARAVHRASAGLRLLVLAALFVGFGLAAWAARRVRA